MRGLNVFSPSLVAAGHMEISQVTAIANASPLHGKKTMVAHDARMHPANPLPRLNLHVPVSTKGNANVADPLSFRVMRQEQECRDADQITSRKRFGEGGNVDSPCYKINRKARGGEGKKK